MELDMAMSLRIGCPQCGKQLSAPPELVNELVACPRCAHQFRISPSGAADVPDDRAYPPANPDFYPPGSVPGTHSKDSSSPPPTTKKPPPSTAEKPGPSPPAAMPHQSARFIERDPNATQVKLGADGQLPDLALSTQKKRQDAKNEATSTSPLVLIGVLCLSVLMSVMILVIDEPTGGTGASQVAARQSLHKVFNSWDPAHPPAPEIRDLLARAFRAYNRGDLEQEKAHYRQVMDLLNREDAPKYGGYTGDDGALKEALTELLR